MIKQKLYFKKLMYDNKSLCGMLDYHENVWTYPKIGKLFVFSTFEHALEYSYGNRIYACQVKHPELCKDILAKEYLNPKYIHRYWRGSVEDNWLEKPPTGTIMCSAVKLLHLVDW